MHCDRPPEMEKSIWVVITVRSDHAKKFCGAKTKSLFGTLQIEIAHEILFTRKSSRTGPKLVTNINIRKTPYLFFVRFTKKVEKA